MEKFKTRSALYLRQMSDDVNKALNVKANELGVAKWVVVEKILETNLGIDKSGIDIHKWLGVNANTARTGKPHSKKLTK